MDPTRTIVARSDPTETQTPMAKNSSFFTFLIALLILIFASGALVLRALLIRRRFRRRVQAAINAATLPNRPLSVEKPELAEIWVRVVSDVRDWHTLQPLCAAKATEHTATQRTDAPRLTAYRPSAAARLMRFLGHHPAVTATAQLRNTEKVPTNREILQIAVLIAMPVEHPPLLPSDGQSTFECAGSEKGKMRNSTVLHRATLPDIMFGVCRYPWSRDDIDEP